MKINFKSGLLLGVLLSIGTIVYGYFYVQNIIEKTKNVASIDLNQFEYENLDGKKVMLSDFADKHILLNFWATWCKPCVAEFPLLKETHDLVADDFVFIMVSYEPKEKIKSFVKDKPYEFIFLKSNNFLVEGISTVPQSFVLDKAQRVMHHHPTIFDDSSEVVSDLLRTWAGVEL